MTNAGKPLTILGINCFGHDTAASILCDGRIVEHHEQERYIRAKHTLKYPYDAIDHAFAQSGISLADVDAIAYPFRVDDELLAAFDAPDGPWRDIAEPLRTRERQRIFELRQKAGYFAEHYGVSPPAVFVGHHEAHAAAAFYSSPFERAAIYSYDGSGDIQTSMAALGEGTRLTVLSRGYSPHGLGYLYSALTRWLGFKPLVDEGKVMGLAPYGRPVFREAFERLARAGDDGEPVLNLDFFAHHRGPIQEMNPALADLIGPRRLFNQRIEARHENIAFSLQERLEELLFVRLNRLWEQTRCDDLCLSGGAALNSVANGKIESRTPFKRVFVPPFVHDAGGAIGAAQWVTHHDRGLPRVAHGDLAALGLGFTPDEVRARIDTFKLPYSVVDDPSDAAAELLSRGLFVGWFQGRAEAGPRALGRRSILADPRGPDVKRLLNAGVKFREGFRPYAPAITVERFSEFFEAEGDEPYMLKVRVVRPDKRDLIPAVTHVDGSGRVQTVSREHNAPFHRLIERFAARTGVPVVLNTSFNVMGEPIVNRIDDAVRCFYSCGLDALVIENIVIVKRPELAGAVG